MRIGTRGSALALAQAQWVADRLAAANPHSPAPQLVVLSTSGDHDTSPPSHRSADLPPHRTAPSARGGDKSRWVDTIEAALLDGTIDLAVHSAKDVPVKLADGLELIGCPARADARDVLVGATSLDELPVGGRVGTSSVRRAAQLLAAREDLRLVSVRGNVDTRLRKLAADAGEGSGGSSGEEQPLNALVLAAAGLQRLGLTEQIGAYLDPERFVPAPGQGLLALQGRHEDDAIRAAVQPLLEEDASACLTAERALARALRASCNTPLGAYAAPAGCGCLVLRAWVGLPDGSRWVRDELIGGFYEPAQLGERVAARMRTAGAGELLAAAEELTTDHV